MRVCRCAHGVNDSPATNGKGGETGRRRGGWGDGQPQVGVGGRQPQRGFGRWRLKLRQTGGIVLPALAGSAAPPALQGRCWRQHRTLEPRLKGGSGGGEAASSGGRRSWHRRQQPAAPHHSSTEPMPATITTCTQSLVVSAPRGPILWRSAAALPQPPQSPCRWPAVPHNRGGHCAAGLNPYPPLPPTCGRSHVAGWRLPTVHASLPACLPSSEASGVAWCVWVCWRVITTVEVTGSGRSRAAKGRAQGGR